MGIKVETWKALSHFFIIYSREVILTFYIEFFEYIVLCSYLFSKLLAYYFVTVQLCISTLLGFFVSFSIIVYCRVCFTDSKTQHIHCFLDLFYIDYIWFSSVSLLYLGFFGLSIIVYCRVCFTVSKTQHIHCILDLFYIDYICSSVF